MVPIIKCNQIKGQARQLRGLGVGRSVPDTRSAVAKDRVQQLESNRLSAETQRENKTETKGDANISDGMAQDSQQHRDNTLSVSSSIEGVHADITAMEPGAGVPKTDGDHTGLPDKIALTEACRATYQQGMQQGWKAGYEQGMQEGLRQGCEEVASLQSCNERLAAVANAINTVSQKWQVELEDAAIEVGYAAMLRIAGQKVGNRAMVESMVRAVLEQLPERRLVSIHLAPADHALLHDGEAVPPSLGAALLADERVRMGGCIVESDVGSLDGRLETRLAELKAALVDIHNARENSQ